MHCPNLNELPPPPPGKSGWPWTSAPHQIVSAPDVKLWPRISIITPSYNQACFLEETIRSVLLQGYPDLEYVIMDGGSNDGSVEIIRKYSKWLSGWVSEADKGQTDAINKGLLRASGQIVAYINSDDTYQPLTLARVADFFNEHKNVSLVYGNYQLIDDQDNERCIHESPGYELKQLLLGDYICQPTAFWRSSVHDRIGVFDANLYYVMDYDFFLRAAIAGGFQFARITGQPLASFRIWKGAKTAIKAEAGLREEIVMLEKYFNNPLLPRELTKLRNRSIVRAYMNVAHTKYRSLEMREARGFLRLAAKIWMPLVFMPSYWSFFIKTSLGARLNSWTRHSKKIFVHFFRTRDHHVVSSHSSGQSVIISNRLKKILFVLPDASLTGSTKVVSQFILFLSKNYGNYKILVHFTKQGVIIDSLKRNHIDCIISAKKSKNASILVKITCRLSYYIKYLFIILKYRPDLVYSNTIFNFGQVMLGKLVGSKTLVHVHEGKSLMKDVKYKLIISNIFVDKYISVSGYVSELLKEYIGATGETISNGVELFELPIRKMDKDCINIGVIGSIAPNKAQHIAVEAVKYLIFELGMRVRLKIFGQISDENYFKDLEGYIEKKGLNDAVEFVGVVSDVREIYGKLDIVLITSYDESFSMVKIEAMSCKKILIASNIIGITDTIEDGKNGLLFNSGDSLELARKIKTIIDDADLRETIIKNAYTDVVRNFSIDDMNKKIYCAVNRLV